VVYRSLHHYDILASLYYRYGTIKTKCSTGMTCYLFCNFAIDLILCFSSNHHTTMTKMFRSATVALFRRGSRFCNNQQGSSAVATHTPNNSALPTTEDACCARQTCGFYVWDIPSALLHKWCMSLMKDCVYEGRGGKKVSLLRVYRFHFEWIFVKFCCLQNIPFNDGSC
jgi:hypothetical protein